MKRIIIIVVLLFFFLTKSAQTLQLRNHGDKILHFTGSYFIAYTTYHYLQPKIGHKKAKTYSIATSIGIGILKEIVEKHGILAAVGFLFTELPYNTASAFLKIAADEALRGRLSDAYNESFDKFYEELSIIVHEEVGIK